MKDYQQKRLKDYTLPEAVYRQALWAVKDLNRAKKKLAELEEDVYRVKGGLALCIGSKGCNIVSDLTGNDASKLAVLSMRISAIEKAFALIPEGYSKGIRDKLVYGIEYGDEAHLNTWKKWQQIFIFHVANNLGLY